MNAEAAIQGNGKTTPVFDEISIIARQLVLGSFDMLLPKDDTLLTRGGGSPMGLKIYDELERDPKAWEVLEKRKMALTSCEWTVEPPEGDNSQLAKKAADMVRAQLNALGFDQLTKVLLDATNKGLAPCEIMWRKDGAEIVADEIIDVEPWLFQFRLKPDPDEYLFARCGVRLLTPGSFGAGMKVPHRKFLLHRFGGKYNNPWGLGLGTRLFWPIFFKRQGIQFWLAFAERFGTPVPVGKYPNNAQPQERATLKAALRAFAQEAAIMVPQGMEIELLEAARSGIDTYERLCKYMDDQTAGIVLGKSGGVGSGGQLAAAINIENEVRLELVKADGDLLSDTLNKQLVRWIVDYNLPGAPYPFVRRIIEEPVDMKAMADTDAVLTGMGFRPTLESIKQRFGGDYIEIKPALATDSAKADAPEFAEPDTPADQAAIDALLSSLAAGTLQSLMEKVLAPVIKTVRSAAGHRGALEKLVELFPDVPLDDLQKSLAHALFVAETVGRLSVQSAHE